jgi:hypothetical protein
MELEETQTTEAEDNVFLGEKNPEPGYMNARKPRITEPITQVQRDNSITSKDLPDPRFRIGVTLVLLMVLLFVSAIYYGIINP